VVVVSITPEIAIEGLNTYAGGLGVLEGDKFYGASRGGISYVVLTLLYKGGYVDYKVTPSGNLVPHEQRQSTVLTKVMKPEEEFCVRVRGEAVYTRPWVYGVGNARVVFFEVECPLWLRRAVERLYIEREDEERVYKWVFLAKASAEYIRRNIGLDRVDVIDLQESYTGLLTLALPEFKKFRFTVHTSAPWGHPHIPAKVLEEEFGVRVNGDGVMLTRVVLDRVEKAFTVSRKHYEITARIFHEYSGKFSYVTNGIDIERWMHPIIKGLIAGRGLEKIEAEELWKVHLEVKGELIKLLSLYKRGLTISREIPIVVWCRRLTRYKRPYFVSWFVEEVGHKLNAVFVLGGKPHPADYDALQMAKRFVELSRMYSNLIYIHDYDLEKAKLLLGGGDLLLFTPFPGWEACGTSYMKASVNGVPTLSSRDGGVLEFIEDGVNGWLFGQELHEIINIYTDRRTSEVDRVEYEEFKRRLIDLIKIYGTAEYKQVALNALKTSIPKFRIERVLRELYPEGFGGEGG